MFVVEWELQIVPRIGSYKLLLWSGVKMR